MTHLLTRCPSVSDSTHEPFASEKSGIAAIGTTQMGLMYFSAPVVALFIQRWPQLARPAMYVAALVMVVSLIAASFCNTVGGLLATQSVMYALGALTVYYPSIKYIDEWFHERKGLVRLPSPTMTIHIIADENAKAYGVMWAGTGSAGVVVPFLLQWLLDSWGFRTALRVWAIILVSKSHHRPTVHY